jgi:hypothetical protein
MRRKNTGDKIKEEMPITRGVFIRGLHPYTFRCGKSALVTGVKHIDDNKGLRVVYEVTHPDGFVDLIPMSEVNGRIYEMIGVTEVER